MSNDEPLKGGYKFMRHEVVIPSIGFADDVVMFAEGWEEIYGMHQWVLEFLDAHEGNLNGLKTVYIISNTKVNDDRWLRTVDDAEPIKPVKADTTFRYLARGSRLLRH